MEAKDLDVLLRFFDTSMMRAVTHFVDLPTANDGTVSAIFDNIDHCLMSQFMPPYWCLFMQFMHSLLVIAIVNTVFPWLGKLTLKIVAI